MNEYEFKIMGLCYDVETYISDMCGDRKITRKEYREIAKKQLLKFAKKDGLSVDHNDLPDLVKAMEELHFDIF